MKFVISSTELLSHLQAISKVISSKNALPILDNFLFDLRENELVVTASDLETTLITKIEIENSDGEGKMAVPAKIILDTLKEFPEQPLTFEIELETYSIDILSENGKFSVVGLDAEEFPKHKEIEEAEAASITMEAEVLHTGISKTIFATSDDELRPVMNGIFVELSPERVSFVASDSHKLVRYRRYDVKSEEESSFILPKKPAALLKGIVEKDEVEVKLSFDSKNAIFEMPKYTMVCRLTEGQYPTYESVIPTDNPNKMIIDRVEFFNTLKRVSLFSSQASNLVKLELKANTINISAQDIDFSISAYERLNCQYDGEEMEIGFKSLFLIEIINTIASPEIVMELSDSSRAGILLPYERENEDEEILMLLMPMMLKQ